MVEIKVDATRKEGERMRPGRNDALTSDLKMRDEKQSSFSTKQLLPIH
jgi:hypothetical protein